MMGVEMTRDKAAMMMMQAKENTLLAMNAGLIPNFRSNEPAMQAVHKAPDTMVERQSSASRYNFNNSGARYYVNGSITNSPYENNQVANDSNQSPASRHGLNNPAARNFKDEGVGMIDRGQRTSGFVFDQHINNSSVSQDQGTSSPKIDLEMIKENQQQEDKSKMQSEVRRLMSENASTGRDILLKEVNSLVREGDFRPIKMFQTTGQTQRMKNLIIGGLATMAASEVQKLTGMNQDEYAQFRHAVSSKEVGIRVPENEVRETFTGVDGNKNNFSNILKNYIEHHVSKMMGRERPKSEEEQKLLDSLPADTVARFEKFREDASRHFAMHGLLNGLRSMSPSEVQQLTGMTDSEYSDFIRREGPGTSAL